MDFNVGYMIFGGLFLCSVVGYWVATRALRDPTRIYAAPEARPGGA